MLNSGFKCPFDKVLDEALYYAEITYDKVVRRWGNIPFAQSTVYDWIWSEEFLQLAHELNEQEKGHVRIQVLKTFRIRPWPWYSTPHSENSLER